MAGWTAFDHASEYRFDAARLKRNWKRLHCGDLEPLPKDAKVLAAWALFHSGAFEKAVEAGLKLGDVGSTVVNKATCIYANYLERKEKSRLELFMQVAQRAAAQASADPSNANAFYWQAYALGHYSQGISVAKALAQGIGSKVKLTLETTIRLQPLHADAHIALGTFHAEVIDKVGALIGNMTYGARKDTSLKLFERALALAPDSALAKMEFANALVMLEGDRRMEDATRLYQEAAAGKALDAPQRLDVEMARAELAD